VDGREGKEERKDGKEVEGIPHKVKVSGINTGLWS